MIKYGLRSFFFLVIVVALSACGLDEPTTSFEGQRLVDNEHLMELTTVNAGTVDQQSTRQRGETRNVPIIAIYDITDDGVVAYEFLDENFEEVPTDQVVGRLLSEEESLSPTAETLANYLDGRNADMREYYEAQSNEDEQLELQGWPTVCSTLEDGCFFLTESEKSYQFNAVRMRIDIPSRANGDIVVEEDNFSACPNNNTSKIEVPYIFTGGHAGTLPLTWENIDAGLQWNCGSNSDNWAVFMSYRNTSGKGKVNSIISWRLISDQEVFMMFFANKNNLPTLFVEGDFIYHPTGGYTLFGSTFYTCSTSQCQSAGRWNATGVDVNFKLEINLAQEPEPDFNSGAIFKNIYVRELVLGNYDYVNTGYQWTREEDWDIDGVNANLSPYTGRQCIVPNNGSYDFENQTNLGSGHGLNVSLELP